MWRSGEKIGSRKPRFSLAFAGGVTCALLALGAVGDDEDVNLSPLNFSHATHFEEDIACLDCHLRAEEGAFATIPGIKTCLLCHEDQQGEDPEEQLVRDYAERGEEIPWVQVNWVVGHVYFSHAMHVVNGELECADCHGDMTAMEEPVRHSQVEWLTMEACMDCHAERQVSNDCILCHK